MATVIYSATMSLDGFIAGPGGDMSWLTPLIGPDPASKELIARIGSLLVGNRSYRGDDPHRDDRMRRGKPFGGGWDGPQFVLAHRPPSKPVEGTTFVDNFDRALAAAKAAAGDKVVNIIGASVARQCLEAGQLDEMAVFVAPVLLGDGTRLFEWPGGRHVRLERIALSHTEKATYLRMRVLR